MIFFREYEEWEWKFLHIRIVRSVNQGVVHLLVWGSVVSAGSTSWRLVWSQGLLQRILAV